VRYYQERDILVEIISIEGSPEAKFPIILPDEKVGGGRV
jgi:hypothetical protein